MNLGRTFKKRREESWREGEEGRRGEEGRARDDENDDGDDDHDDDDDCNKRRGAVIIHRDIFCFSSSFSFCVWGLSCCCFLCGSDETENRRNAPNFAICVTGRKEEVEKERK